MSKFSGALGSRFSGSSFCIIINFSISQLILMSSTIDYDTKNYIEPRIAGLKPTNTVLVDRVSIGLQAGAYLIK